MNQLKEIECSYENFLIYAFIIACALAGCNNKANNPVSSARNSEADSVNSDEAIKERVVADYSQRLKKTQAKMNLRIAT